MRLDISIDPERVEVRFGIIRKTIPIEEIVSCEPTHASITVYGGVGIRYGIDGSMAFTTCARANKIKNIVPEPIP